MIRNTRSVCDAALRANVGSASAFPVFLERAYELGDSLSIGLSTR